MMMEVVKRINCRPGREVKNRVGPLGQQLGGEVMRRGEALQAVRKLKGVIHQVTADTEPVIGGIDWDMTRRMPAKRRREYLREPGAHLHLPPVNLTHSSSSTSTVMWSSSTKCEKNIMQSLWHAPPVQEAIQHEEYHVVRRPPIGRAQSGIA